MKRLVFISMLFLLFSCSKEKSVDIVVSEKGDATDGIEFTSKGIARMLSELPLEPANVQEVYDAVNSSSSNGYDEEYMMKDVLCSPGAGVGDVQSVRSTRATSYSRPLKDLIAEYYGSVSVTGKAESGATDVESLLEKLSASGLQIYWPNSEAWDGRTLPLITWDPGYGAESNYAYEIEVNERGFRVVDSLVVTEQTAEHRPVWVINSNNDSAYTPLDMYLSTKTSLCPSPVVRKGKAMRLVLKRFKMLRNYDSWFAGASEFFIKCGAPDGFNATTEAELRLYTPTVTDFMVVVKRKYCGVDLELNTLILTNFTSQLEQLAFLVTEDDGGTTTSWKCSAVVKVSSKSYGIEMDIPYKDKDDIVWRGQLSAEFFREADEVTARFGDTEITFALE